MWTSCSLTHLLAALFQMCQGNFYYHSIAVSSNYFPDYTLMNNYLIIMFFFFFFSCHHCAHWMIYQLRLLDRVWCSSKWFFFLIIHAFLQIMGSSLYGLLTMHFLIGCSYPANICFTLMLLFSSMKAEARIREIPFSIFYVLIIFWWYQMVKQLSFSRCRGGKKTYLWFHSTLSHHCWVEVKEFFGQELGAHSKIDHLVRYSWHFSVSHDRTP